jgi:DNA-binding CsgD family transcriptional regulator
MRTETRLLQTKPHLSIEGFNLNNLHQADIIGITVGKNEINVDLEASELHDLNLVQVAFFGSLGYSTEQIAGALFLSAEATKSRALRLHKAVGSIGKSAYAKYLFETGVYVANTAEPVLLDLAPRQREIIDHASYGEGYKQIADELSISPLTVKSQILKATARTGWVGRNELILAAFASGDIGEYAAQSAEILAEPLGYIAPAAEVPLMGEQRAA